MRPIGIILAFVTILLVIFAVAGAAHEKDIERQLRLTGKCGGACWVTKIECNQPQHPSYTVKQFCAEHPDVCSKSRLAHYATPSPIPSNKGYVVIYP